MSISSVTVYCSSSKRIAPEYFAAARDLGRSIAREGWLLVYGGNYLGLMGEVADGARDEGGKVIGITPRLLHDKGFSDEKCDELVITETMRQRKALLENRADAFVVLPGGVGTFEEFFEVLVARQLGYHDKPIVVLNINGFYKPLLELLEHGLREGFIRENLRNVMAVAQTVPEAITLLKQPPLSPAPPTSAPPSAIE